SYVQRVYASSNTTTTTTAAAAAGRGWRRYANQFRNAPATHITSFAILHELTAIAPIPIIYYALDKADIELPLPETALHDGEQFARRLVARYGWGTSTDNADATATSDSSVVGATSRVFVNLAIAYGVVKVLLPVRVAACVALTPWFARTIVTPVVNGARGL
ncbi:hypothetical protein SYNPS1DRAFT_7434, partial [Syncephalis pseudoplumigaleata]